MSTLTELRARFREVLALPATTDVDEGDPPRAVITKLLNEAMQRTWLSLASSYPRRLATRTSFTYTANTDSVSLPAAARSRMVSRIEVLPQNAVDTRGLIECDPVASDEIDNYAGSGFPEVYSIGFVDQSIKLRPAPAWDATVYVTYVAGLTDMSLDADTPVTSGCPVPAEFHQLFVYQAAEQYCREVGDPAEMRHATTANEIMATLKKYVERSYQDTGFRVRRNNRMY